MYCVFPVSEIATLSNPSVYSSFLNCSSILSKVKEVINQDLVFRALGLLKVPDIDSDY